jgi:hypothetical protein
MKAERTIQDELRRILATRSNPAVHFESAEDRLLLGAQVALEWVLKRGEPPLPFCIRVGAAPPSGRAP